MAFPSGMALDPDGRLWVADTGNSRFAIFDPDGTFIEYWEHRGSGEGEFLLERSNGDGFGAIAFAPDGSFYVLDVGNHRVEHFDRERKFIFAWGGFGGDAGKFIDPVGLAVNSQGVIYVIDDKRDVVERYEPDGTVLGQINPYQDAPTGYDSAGPFVVDAYGNVYTGIWRVRNEVMKLDPSGARIGTFGSTGSGPGQFPGQPGAGAVDAAGRLFVGVGVLDESSPMASVWIFAGDGSYQTSFTVPGLTRTTDGFITALILDGMGNGYVAESSSNLVEKFRLLPPFAP
jgi:tripartite motif-containing protein 71